MLPIIIQKSILPLFYYCNKKIKWNLSIKAQSKFTFHKYIEHSNIGKFHSFYPISILHKPLMPDNMTKNQ